MKYPALLFILAFYLTSCNSSNRKTDNPNRSELPFHIDLTQSQPRDIFLSDFADDISYIRLHSDGPLVGGLCNLFIGPDQFIINDFGQELMVFAKDGRFMNKIGHRGAGPGEYMYTNNFIFDEENRRYCLSRDTTNEIKVFNLADGEEPVGVRNDLDGGPILIWQFTYRDGYVYCLWQAIDLIQAKEAGDFDRIEPKYPEKKKQLLQMIDSLKPNDNPVIMRVKIRDLLGLPENP